MTYTEQDLKDEYEQAVKRKGKLYAEGYVEGLKDSDSNASKHILGIIEKLKNDSVRSGKTLNSVCDYLTQKIKGE